jgi:hypothetical protein
VRDGPETCDAALDCQDRTPPPVDDGIACTDDSCDEFVGCSHESIENCAVPPAVPSAPLWSRALLALLFVLGGERLRRRLRASRTGTPAMTTSSTTTRPRR